MEKSRFYMTTIDDRPASVMVNLALSGELKPNHLPWLTVIVVAMRAPNFQGLSSPEEFAVGAGIYDQLVDTADTQSMQIAGMITTDGNWQFCIYSDENFLRTSIVAEILGRFPGYEFSVHRRLDPEHSAYFTSFYPSDPYKVHQILNFELIQSLLQQHTDLRVPHEITYSLDIPKVQMQKAIEQIRNSARFEGFVIRPNDNTLEVTGERMVDLSTIDDDMFELVRCAELHCGEYLGCDVLV